MRNLRPSVVTAASLALLCACTALPSRIVVVVGTDLGIPGEIDSVLVRVATPSGPRPDVVVPLGRETPVPLSVVIEQAGGGRGAVRVEVVGRRAGEPIVRHLVRTGFSAGRTVALDVFLSAACAGVFCGTETTCLPCSESTCATTVECARLDVPPETLRPIGAPGDELDGGPRGFDAPLLRDIGARDTGPDTNLPPRDTGVRDGGPPLDGGASDGGGGLTAPELLTPHIGAATGRHLRGTPLPRFAWRPVARAARYELELTTTCTSIAACTTNPAPFSETGAVHLAPPALPAPEIVPPEASVSIPPAGARYYWRARGCGPDPMPRACGPWSAIRYVDLGRLRDDLNGDGFSDVVVAARSGSGPGGPDTLLVFRGGDTPAMAFAPAERIGLADLPGAPAVGTLGEALTVADVDGNGIADIVALSCNAGSCATSPEASVWTWFGWAAGLSTMPEERRVPAAILAGTDAPAMVDVGDTDGNGSRDIAFRANAAWQLLTGGSSAAERSFTDVRVTTHHAPTGDCDIDLDGLPDLVFDLDDGPGVVIALQPGRATGSFDMWTPTPVADAATCGDLNGDGMADLAVTDALGSTLHLRFRAPDAAAGWGEQVVPLPAPFGPGFDQMRVAALADGTTWVVLTGADRPLLVAPMLGGMSMMPRTLDPAPSGRRVLSIAQDALGRGSSTVLVGLPDAANGGALGWLDDASFTLTYIEGASRSVTLLGSALARLDAPGRVGRPGGDPAPWLAIFDVLGTRLPERRGEL